MKANLVRAYGNFNDDMFEACAKQVEFKAIVFALCYFHAALLERKKFGVGNLPGSTSGIGWNMNYPFNVRLPRKRACLVCSRADTRLSPRLRRLATCCAAASWPTTTWRTAARCLGTT